MTRKSTRRAKESDKEQFPLRRYKGEGRVAFLANLESIRGMMERGWPLMAVYDRHAQYLGIKYTQFHRYVSKYILDIANDSPHAEAQEEDTGPIRPVPVPIKPMPLKPTGGIKSFKKGPSDPKPRDVW
jgi:hypothetical protein